MENTMDPYYLRPVFEQTYLDSSEMYEFRYIFKEEWENKSYPLRFKYFINQAELVDSIVIDAMLLRHYQTIEQLNYYPRASDIAEIEAIQFMEVEIEDHLDEIFTKKYQPKMKAEEKETEVPMWAKRELTRHAINGVSSRSDEYDLHISVATLGGLEVLKNGGSLDDAVIEMNLYLSTID